MAGLEEGLSVTMDELELDFSWILKITEQEKDVPHNTYTISISPDRNFSSGYDSLGEDSERWTPLPTAHENQHFNHWPSSTGINGNVWEPQQPSAAVMQLSQNVGQVDEPVPLWSQAGVVGPKNLQQSIFLGVPYSLHSAAPHDNFVCGSEINFHLIPQQDSGSDVEPIDQTSTMKICAHVTHSSGYSNLVEMQQLDITPRGYRCSFIPFYAGKYSAKVFMCTKDPTIDNAHSHFSETLQICSPLEVEVSRNYATESRNPHLPRISLAENGAKYWGISADTFSDLLYVSDRCNNDIIIINPTVGTPIFRFGQSPGPHSLTYQLYRPTGLAVDNISKRVLICDKDNHRICIFTLDGSFISSFGKRGHATGEFNYPWDIDISPNGDMLVVSDSRNHRIQFFDRFGNYLSTFSVFETDPYEFKKIFDYPRGITFSPDGKTVFITDFNTNSVVSVDVNSLECETVIPQGKLCRPQGITSDQSGNILVCDSRKDLLRVLDRGGNQVCALNRIGHFQINAPADSCCFRDGCVATLGLDGSIYFI